MLEHDAAELGAAELARFGPCAMTPGQKSLVLKHAAAWQRALGRRQARILVFEDDVLLAEGFAAGFAAAMRAADALAPGWLVFLVATGQPVDGFYVNEATARDMARHWSSKQMREDLLRRLAHCRLVPCPKGNCGTIDICF